MSKLNIAQLAVNTKKVEFDFPGFPGMKVSLAYQSRKSLQEIRKESTVTKIDPETGFPYEDLDTNAYISNYTSKVIVGWTGFKMAYLARLVLIDEDQIEDMDEMLDYDVETATFLVTNSERFDNWVTQTLGKLDNFRS